MITPIAFPFRRLLTLAVMPLGIMLALLVIAAWTRKRRWVIAALVTTYVFAIPFVGSRLVDFLERQYPEISVEQCPAADAIVALGGVVAGVSALDHRPEWSGSVDRFERGVQLRQAGRAPLLIFGGGLIEWLGETEGDIMRREAIARGVPPDSIHVLRNVGNTGQEARAVAELAAKRGFRRVILVTSAFHMPRAKLLFDRHDLDVIPFPTDYHGSEPRPVELLDFIPQAGAFGNTEQALKEFYGLLYYRFAR